MTSETRIVQRLTTMRDEHLPTFYEFFAGGGMVRAALGGQWKCVFANDFDLKKGQTYRANWGDEELRTKDIREISISELPRSPDLIWASFPCQDLSLAGGGAGLEGNRSGTFWPLWNLVRQIRTRDVAPPIIALENVCGTLTSHGGKDFKAIIEAFADINYDVGAVVVDAELFLPQSRPRLFVIGVPSESRDRTFELFGEDEALWHPPSLRRAYASLPVKLRDRWIWWNIPVPNHRNQSIADILEHDPKDVSWNTAEETLRIVDMMSPLNKRKLEKARAQKSTVVGTFYRRTRTEGGEPVQRVEVRFDGVAGCLRTPAGGSSRQSVLIVKGNKVRSRLLSARETARLMGLDDSYKLPSKYNEAYHLTGDGVAVPAVKHISDHVLLPLAKARTAPQKRRRKAA
jgi:DNA (cytosine-5)-methyltransferase 1